jgi:endonuclease-3
LGPGQAQARRAVAGLRRLYPDAHCELDFKTPLELIVATILSAQCTDKRVNVVTRALFRRYRTAADYAAAVPGELEGLIRSAGFYRAKAKSIREAARVIAAEFGGKVPDTMEDLLKLRGVARKTANVVLGTAFGKAEGIVVDTHMKRVAYRLGLTDETDPVKIERDLVACVPRKDWIFFGHAMIWHGRRVCFARNPACPACALRSFCPKRGV